MGKRRKKRKKITAKKSHVDVIETTGETVTEEPSLNPGALFNSTAEAMDPVVPPEIFSYKTLVYSVLTVVAYIGWIYLLDAI